MDRHPIAISKAPPTGGRPALPPGRRALRLLSLATLLIGVGGLGLAVDDATPAQAHVPFLEPAQSSDAPPESSTDPDVLTDPFPGAVEVPDPSVSRAVYGILAPGEAFDIYRFRVAEPVEIPVSILVPARDELATFRPSFALIGPGLPGSVAGLPPSLRERIAAGADPATSGRPLGATTVNAPGQEWGSFFEPFSFERYHAGPEIQVPLEPDQDYYVAVFHPQGERGDYVLGLGTREAFGAADIARSIAAVARIKLGLYGQGELRWGPLAVAVAVVLLIAGAAAVLLARRRARRSDA